MAKTKNPGQLPVKLAKPALKSVVVRQHLFGSLDTFFSDSQIVWIQAPAGFGKSTLAASYAGHMDCPSLWYRFDEGDHDPATFFDHFLTTAQATFTVQETPVTFRAEYLGGISAYSRQFFRTLLEDKGATRLVVLDDFHCLNQATLTLSAVIALAQECPASYRLLIMSRNEPPPEFASVLYAAIKVLPADFLYFDENDALKLANLMAYNSQSPDWTDLLARCNGWVAALVINMRHQSHQHYAAQKLLHPLANTALSGLELKVQQQLLKLALAKTMTESLAVELTGDTNVKSTLARLANEYYLVSRSDATFVSYEIHPLLRGFLLERQRELLTADAFTAFQIRTATALERHGQVEQAVELFSQAGQWQEVQRIILVSAKAELTAGRSIRLLSWLNTLPELPKRNPWLDFWQATAYLALNPKQSQALFERAHQGFGINPVGRAISAAGVLTAMLIVFDDFTGVPRWFDELAKLDSFISIIPDPEIKAWVLSCGALLALFDIHAGLLQKWQKRSLQLLTSCSPERRIYLAASLLQCSILQGDIDNCQSLLALLQSHKPQNDPLFQIYLLDWKAIAAYLAGDFETAYLAIEQAHQIAETYGLIYIKSIIYGHEAYTAFFSQDFARAASALKKMETHLVPERRLDMVFFLHVRSGFSFFQNNFVQAKHDAELALALNRELNFIAPSALVQQVLAQILIALNEAPLALTHLDQVDDFCGRTGKLLLLFTSQLTRAYALLSLSDELTAVKVLKSALALGRERNYLNYAHPFWQPDAIASLCAFALDKDIEPDYVRRLIVKRGHKPGSNASEHWPWPLKIRTLGNFRIDNGAVSQIKLNKKDSKPLQLLQWLVAVNPDGVPRQTLADLLWPDADADAALHSFEVNLQRLRKLIGLDDAILLHGNRIRINRSLCWLDFWTLDDVVRQLDKGQANATTLAERLLRVWHGPFMPGIEHPLILNKREIVTAKCIRVMEKLGLLLEASDDYQTAIDCYSRAIEIEPLAETMHNRLITCLKNADRKTEAMLAYRRCAQFYATQAGIKISAALRNLGESL